MYNILLSGVGGQGTVLASKLIAAAALSAGHDVHTAETIGMAQRGGCVVSHVRIGENVYSPLIPKGTADIIIAFEPAEAVRALPYLKCGGTIVTSSAAVKPVTDMFAESAYDAGLMFDCLKQNKIKTFVVDADTIINTFGNAKSLNVALLGAATVNCDIGITKDDIAKAILSSTKAAFHEQNLKALEIGAEFSKELE